MILFFKRIIRIDNKHIHTPKLWCCYKLEFIDYSDPNYQVDQGNSDEFVDENETSDDELIEQMREERRCKNDEYQFESYFKEILKDGETFKGEWTIYRTSTFLPDQQKNLDDNGFPLLIPDDTIIKVISQAKKIPLLAHLEGIGPVPLTAIVHEERLATDKDFSAGDLEKDGRYSGIGSGDSAAAAAAADGSIVGQAYWPEELFASDFRGPSGIMYVGNAYTICHAKTLTSVNGEHTQDDEGLMGPFSQMCTELGLTYKRMKYRMKLDYRIKDLERDRVQNPPLHLYSLTICREALERWPRYNTDSPSNDDGKVSMSEVNVDDVSTENLFGSIGAAGGLYDPPLIGTEQQSNYMFIDLEGSASALFPYIIDQDPLIHGADATWVTSLDWTPGRYRYQVDRKFLGGQNIRGLKTLELSEVEADQGELWRPRDGGMDMRQ